MNYGRIALAAVGGTVAYFVTGLALFMLVPQMMEEGRKYSAVFRSGEEQMARMPVIMAGRSSPSSFLQSSTRALIAGLRSRSRGALRFADRSVRRMRVRGP